MTNAPLENTSATQPSVTTTQTPATAGTQSNSPLIQLLKSPVLRISLLLALLITLSIVAFLLWRITQKQDNADYIISGEDLFNTGIIDKIVDEGTPQVVTPGDTKSPTTGGKSAPLAKGEQTYFIRTSGDGPKLTKLVINEFDPKVGTKQAAKVEVQSPEPVSKVTIKLQTDTKTEVIHLSLAEGDYFKGTWLGEWPVADTHENIYTLIVEAESEKLPTSSITLSFR